MDRYRISFFFWCKSNNFASPWFVHVNVSAFSPASSGDAYSYVHEEQPAHEDVAVRLYSRRWRRWLPPKPRNMDSNRAGVDQDQEPEQEQPERFPGLLTPEESDNSSQIEVGEDPRDRQRLIFACVTAQSHVDGSSQHFSPSDLKLFSSGRRCRRPTTDLLRVPG